MERKSTTFYCQQANADGGHTKQKINKQEEDQGKGGVPTQPKEKWVSKEATGHDNRVESVNQAGNAQIIASIITGKIKVKVKEESPRFVYQNGTIWKRSNGGFLTEAVGICFGGTKSSGQNKQREGREDVRKRGKKSFTRATRSLGCL